MKRPRFYEEQTFQTGSGVTLSEQASHHIHTVLRMAEGTGLVLFNGKGGEYHGTITKSHKKHCEVKIEQFFEDNRTPDLEIHLGQVIGKGDKTETVIQKATEMGVAEITPLTSLHSDFKLKAERQEKKFRQWQQIIISACEQSGLNILPTLHPVKSFDQWITSVEASKKFILHPHCNSPATPGDLAANIILAVGPEGGFSTEELEIANSAGFTSLQLGSRVLRTETAAIAATGFLYGLSGTYS